MILSGAWQTAPIRLREETRRMERESASGIRLPRREGSTAIKMQMWRVTISTDTKRTLP